ncbi:MAG: GNAT family N-acetyltransferase [Anaerolineae bacterium]
MADMLVKLYNLPPLEPELAAMKAKGITIRRAIPPEKHVVLGWIKEHFGDAWVSEADVAISHDPIDCWLAVEGDQLIGFGCCNTTARAFFGPTGVSEAQRGRGVGRALLIVCLHALYWEGYAYGIIGDPGPTEFYEKVVGATIIPDSEPGVYAGMLR